MNEVRYFNKPGNVLFFSPVVRLLAKVFGRETFIVRCKTCGKIPTEVYDGGYCKKHLK